MIATCSARPGCKGRAAFKALLIGSTLSSGLIAAISAVQAQTLPVINDAGTAVVSMPDANTLQIDLQAGNQVIGYDSFNVGSSETVNFITTANSNFAVLNRVTLQNPSSILGVITSPNNVAIWLVNPSGVTFGSGGSFSGGSLVLSTIAISDNEFLNGDGDAFHDFAGGSTASIDLNNGSLITTTTGSFLALAQQISSAGTINASGEAILVAAQGIKVPVGLGSPLSIEITAGTTLGILSSGNISGSSVKLVGASEGGAIENLLNVTAGTLTATSSGGRILISTAADAASGLSISALPGSDDVSVSGALLASTSGGNVVVAATNAVSVLNNVNSTGMTTTITGESVFLPTIDVVGSLLVTAASGQLTIGTASTTEQAEIVKTGVAGELEITTALMAGTDVLIDSATSARLNSVTSTAGNVDVRAVAEVTGLVPPGPSPLVDGLRVAALTSGGTATLGATTGDIRIGMATVAMPQGGVTSTGGNVGVTATLGSVTGLASADTPAGPGADLTATAGLVKVMAGTRAALDEVEASGSIDVAGAQISVGTAMAGTSLTLTAGNALSLDSGMAGTTSSLTTSSGAAAMVALTSTTATLDTGFGAANLTAGTALTTGNDVTVRADRIAQLGTVFAANAIDVAARALTVNRATATNDALRLTASHGGLYLGTGVAGTTATLIKTDIDGDGLTPAEANKDELRVTTALMAGTDVLIDSATSARLNSVTAATGSIAVTSTQATTGSAGASAGASDPDFGRATLIANGLGRDVTVTTGTLAQLGSVSAGRNVSVTAGNATSMLNGAIDISSATATAGSLLLSARAISPVTGSMLDGDIILGTGAAGTTATLSNVDRGGTAGDVRVNTSVVSNSDATINSAGNSRLAEVASTAGSIMTTATQATTGTIGASAGTTDIGFGRAILTANGLGRDINVTTGTLAQLGSVSAGRNVSVTAGNALPQNGAIDVTSVTATSGSLLLSARADLPVIGTVQDGDIILGIGMAGTTSILSNTNLGGANGNITVSTSLVSAGNVLIDAVSDAALGIVRSTAGNIAITSQTIGLNSLVETLATAGTITLTNRAGGASAKTILGAESTVDFALTAAEFNFLRSTSLTVESGAQAVEIGTLPLLASNGSTSLRLLTTNSVLLTGLISDAGNAQARTIQIGGTLATPANPVSSSGADLATQILGISTPTGGGRINLSAANLDLRAARVVFGLQALADATLPLTPERVSVDFVAQTNSLLYNSNLLRNSSGFQSTSGEVFQTLIRANVLTVRYRDFALFQNTGSVGRSGGIVLGVDDQSLPTATTSLALQLFGTGDITTPNSNAFGLFGRVNGFIDRTAGILPSAVLDFADGTGTNRVVRITQSNSRVNGCAIGSPDKGCLVTEAPPPIVKLFDERQSQLFGVADDLDVPFDPLVGSNNEALIGDIGTGDFALLDVVCTSVNTENCSSNGAPQ